MPQLGSMATATLGALIISTALAGCGQSAAPPLTRAPVIKSAILHIYPTPADTESAAGPSQGILWVLAGSPQTLGSVFLASGTAHRRPRPPAIRSQPHSGSAEKSDLGCRVSHCQDRSRPVVQCPVREGAGALPTAGSSAGRDSGASRTASLCAVPNPHPGHGGSRVTPRHEAHGHMGRAVFYGELGSRPQRRSCLHAHQRGTGHRVTGGVFASGLNAICGRTVWVQSGAQPARHPPLRAEGTGTGPQYCCRVACYRKRAESTASASCQPTNPHEREWQRSVCSRGHLRLRQYPDDHRAWRLTARAGAPAA